jgi:hypothetical protein
VFKMAGNADNSDVCSGFDWPFLVNSRVEPPVRSRLFAFISFHVCIRGLTTLGTA